MASVSEMFSGGANRSKQQSQQTSAPVINQPGLNMLTQNAQNTQNLVNQTYQPYTAQMTAPLAPNQQQAAASAPGMLTAGLPALSGATQGAFGLLGYQAPQATASLASPGIIGSTPSYSPNMLGMAPVASIAQASPNSYKASLIGDIPQVNGASAGNSSSIAGLMGQFENPYTSQVINATNAEINQQRQQALMGNNQAATLEGAFGGNRQGVADALTNKQYDMDTALTDSNLNQQGFNTALNAGTQQAGMNNQMGQFNAANQQQASLANAANALAVAQANQNASNAASATNAGAANTASLANSSQANAQAQFNAGMLGNFAQANQGAANAAGQFNTGLLNENQQFNAGNQQQANLTNASALNNMGQFNVGSNLSSVGINANAAGLLGNLGGQAQNQYGNYLNALSNTGATEQQTQQNYLTNLYQEFLRQQEYPLQGQQLVNQSMGLIPYSLGQSSQGTSSGKTTGWNFGQSGSFSYMG